MSGELMTDINGKEWITCECGNRIPAEWGEDACPACMQEAKEMAELAPIINQATQISEDDRSNFGRCIRATSCRVQFSAALTNL